MYNIHYGAERPYKLNKTHKISLPFGFTQETKNLTCRQVGSKAAGFLGTVRGVLELSCKHIFILVKMVACTLIGFINI